MPAGDPLNTWVPVRASWRRGSVVNYWSYEVSRLLRAAIVRAPLDVPMEDRPKLKAGFLSDRLHP